MKALLQTYDANVLKQIAREHGFAQKGNSSKAVVVDWLATKFAEQSYITQALAQLKPVEHELLSRIQTAGGEVAAEALKESMRVTQLIAPAKKPRQAWEIWRSEDAQGNPYYTDKKPAFEDVVARLTLVGLLFSREVADTFRQVFKWDVGRYLVIPAEVRALLPNAPATVEASGEPPRIARASAQTLQRELARYWSMVKREGKLELTTQGWLYKKTVTELAKTFGWPEQKKRDEKTDERLFFLRQMLYALHLVEPENGYEEAGVWLPLDAQAFWGKPPAERVKETFMVWRDGVRWNELRMPATSYSANHRRAAPAELTAARGVVLEHLRRKGAGAWIPLKNLVDGIRLGNYEFLFPRQKQLYNYGYGNYSTPYYQANNPYGVGYKDIESEKEGWAKVEAVIIAHIIEGPLHWLGLVDVGYEADGTTLRAYQLTAMGAWFLGLGSAVDMTREGGRVVVQPNFQIVAMEPITEEMLMTLDEFAQFEGGDNALTYRLTRESVYRGQRASWDATRICAYLEHHSQLPMPANIERTLEEWDGLHGRITIRRNVTLVQTEDATTLDTLLTHSELVTPLGRRAAPTVALPNVAAKAVSEVLHAAGWPTLVTHHGDQHPHGNLKADAEGGIEFLARTPSIYAYGMIEAFAQVTDARHARITADTVKDAIKALGGVPAILSRLQDAHHGDVPPKLVQRIKAWGSYYGEAKAGTLTLIEFRDEGARKELLTDPELKPYLKRFEAGTRPIVSVRAEDLETVKTLLAERGIAVSALK